MKKWSRINYLPCLPLGDNQSKITECERHRELSREAAVEGTVLLKNNNHILPLKKESKLAVFGKAQIDYVKGGGGSGDVRTSHVYNIYEALKKKKQIEIFDRLSLFYMEYVEKSYRSGGQIGMLKEAEIPEEILMEAVEYTDTAVITINRFSSEGYDRRNDGTDTYFYLSVEEKKMVQIVCSHFKHVVVLLNTGAMIDTAWFARNEKIEAALMIWQGGMEGALAAADILTGDAVPSGRLADTCAETFEDYPSSEGFHESEEYVKYTEDVFVGYRYFETIPGKKERVIYPFGYGLSYTEFVFHNLSACCLGDRIIVQAEVENVGDYAGKEVVQVYYQAPKGKITKPARELCAFAKTKLLAPGEKENLLLSWPVADMASYDDIGEVKKSAWVMEKGAYSIHVGNSVRSTVKLDYEYVLVADVVVSQLTECCSPQRLGRRLNEDGNYTEVPETSVTRTTYPCTYICEEKIPEKREEIKNLIDVWNGTISLDEFLTQLTNSELISLLIGQPNRGVADTGGIGNLEKYGIPNPMTADGPAGVRVNGGCDVTTTAFPVASMLACTWNTELVEQVGRAGALEAKENNLFIWLTPALNIHRSPLCGRNFEYYSEDPFISGKMAAAMVRGIQSQGIAAAAKHFVCNNKETNRTESDSILSERALREIYLKGFEICVKESQPKLIMTSYNRMNGIHTSENAELLTGILRNEWKFTGLVTTDWWNTASHAAEVKAGNDLRMPLSAKDDLEEKFAEGVVTRNEIAICAKRILELLLWME